MLRPRTFEPPAVVAALPHHHHRHHYKRPEYQSSIGVK